MAPGGHRRRNLGPWPRAESKLPLISLPTPAKRCRTAWAATVDAERTVRYRIEAWKQDPLTDHASKTRLSVA